MVALGLCCMDLGTWVTYRSFATTMSQHNTVITQQSQHNSVTTKHCHNTSVTTQQCHNTTQQCHNTTVTTQQSQHNTVTTQQCQHNTVTTQHCHNTTVSQHNSHNTTLSQHNSVTTQHCHNSKCVIFQERLLKVLKCYNFLWVQRRHNCSPAASFANCVMTLYLLKVHLQTFLSIPITQKYQILNSDILVANDRYAV